MFLFNIKVFFVINLYYIILMTIIKPLTSYTFWLEEIFTLHQIVDLRLPFFIMWVAKNWETVF